MEQLKKIARLLFAYRKFLLMLLFLFLFAAPTAHALGDFTAALGNCDGSYNKECFDTDTISDVMSTFACGMGGEALECHEEKFGVGLLGITTEMIAGMYANPPASGIYYAMDRLQHFGVVQPAYAQAPGIGFSGLQPLLPIWRAFRNFSYIIFAIVFVVMGFMIMFKVQLSPQTTITLQSAIPRVVIALLLITFSYAIVGFLVDLIYILIALVALIFEQIPVPGQQTNLQADFLEGGFFSAVGYILGTIGSGGAVAFGTMGALGGGLAILLHGAMAFLIKAPLLPIALTNPAGAIAFGAIGGVIGVGALLGILVLLAILAYLLIKLFIELLKSYLAIIIGLIIAPLQISLGVIPGMPGFGQWFRAMAANVLVFPAVAFVLILARTLTQTMGGVELWHPPLFLGGSFAASFVPLLVGFGFLLVVPQVPGAVRKAFGVEGLGLNPLAVVASGVGLVAGGVTSGISRYQGEKVKRAQERQLEALERMSPPP